MVINSALLAVGLYACCARRRKGKNEEDDDVDTALVSKKAAQDPASGVVSKNIQRAIDDG